MRPAVNLSMILLLVGCTRYEYAIVQPPDLSGHVGAKDDYTFHREPLEYKLRTVSNYLVMRVYNPTGDPITLLGQQSTAVSPDGQSHPLRTQTIAPNSFIKLIFPPPWPRVYDYGPTFGIGVGAIYGCSADYPYYGGVFYDDPWDEPLYLTVYDDSNTFWWDWDGEGEMRLTIVFERFQKTFSHDFVIGRGRLK